MKALPMRVVFSAVIGATVLLGVIDTTLAQPQFPEIKFINVTSGDVTGLIDAVNQANENLGVLYSVDIIPDEHGNYPPFVFESEWAGGNALPLLRGQMSIGSDLPIQFQLIGNGNFRLIEVVGNGNPFLSISKFRIAGFGTDGDGGVALVGGNGELHLNSCELADNKASGSGSVVSVSGNGRFVSIKSEFLNNTAGDSGGVALARDNGSLLFEDSVVDNNQAGNSGGVALVWESAGIWVIGSTFTGNQAEFGGAFSIQNDAPEFTTYFSTNWFSKNVAYAGCDLDFFNSLNPLTIVVSNIFESKCELAPINIERSHVRFLSNTFDYDSYAIISIDPSLSWLGGNLYNLDDAEDLQPDISSSPAKAETACFDSGTDAYKSMGYNLAPDDSCALNHPTDLPDTNPMIERNENNLWVPQPDSPAIDSGATDVIVFDGDDLATLPCGYRDISGTARPQDANGDGVFECDRGAMEVPGAGEIVPGHSATYFNRNRNGEGNFVEILSDTLAVVYTFTFRPDASGPAWFVGLGAVGDNQIVIEELLRPIGTSFGDGFDAGDIELTPAGGMSMVFPDCPARDSPGNVAYSGAVDIGYEGLISRAERLSHVVGCGLGTVPSPNAGLSGSFFDRDRNGEGIIVQWLPDGRVLVIFFTYDLNGNQMWILGTGEANGTSVSIDALYPTGFTGWGRAFDADEVKLTAWGTFMLEWVDCNTVIFSYDSATPGYGSAVRNYTRLSKLKGLDCPAF